MSLQNPWMNLVDIKFNIPALVPVTICTTKHVLMLSLMDY